jgi:hypothetical protein
VALRNIAKDPKATVKQRLRACELQAIIAGYIEDRARAEAELAADTKIASERPRMSSRLMELIDRERREEAEKGSPDAQGPGLRQ